MYIGRCAVIGLVVLTFLWIPVISAVNRSLFVTASQVMRHLGPTITAVFLCGMLFPQVNEQGALIGLLTGSTIGLIRLAIYLIFQHTCDDQVHGNHQVRLICYNSVL